MTLPANHAERLVRARLALEGLSVGDALGQICFHPDDFANLLADPNATPHAKAPWPWTDDTAMALGIFDILDERGRIDQDALARRFAVRFAAQPWRGYGGGAIRMLGAVADGAAWRDVVRNMFGGQGSFGNGSAMRIAPLAAYFAEDGYAVVAEQAALSAAVTHAHSEGIAGGIAAAVAGAYAWVNRERRSDPTVKSGLFEEVLRHTPPGEVRKGIEHASILDLELSIEATSRLLGNGLRLSCQDTVPFCLWVAARNLDDYQTAIVGAIRAAGDIDTNAAIVGGIVALSTGLDSIPADWRADREELVI